MDPVLKWRRGRDCPACGPGGIPPVEDPSPERDRSHAHLSPPEETRVRWGEREGRERGRERREGGKEERERGREGKRKGMSEEGREGEGRESESEGREGEREKERE